MKPLHFKKSLLNSLLIACFWLTTTQAGWAATKKQQKSTKASKTAQAKKTTQATDSHRTLAEVHRLGKTDLDHVTVQGKTQVLGKCTIKDSQLNTLEVRGTTNIINTSIQGAVAIQGMTEIANSECRKLKVQGRLLMSESTVHGKLKVQGNFQANFLGQVQAMGHFNAQSSVFQQEVNMVGNLQAHQTSFAHTITAVTQEIKLHDTTAQDIYVKDSKNEIKKWGKKHKFLSFLVDKQDEPQVVTLSGKTVIQGSITFENGQGMVILKDEAQLQGEVLGGTIKRLGE